MTDSSTEWRAQRKQLAPAFTPRAVEKSYSTKIDSIVQEWIAKFSHPEAGKDGPSVVDYQKMLTNLSLDLNLRLLFDHHEPDAEIEAIAADFESFRAETKLSYVNPFSAPISDLPELTRIQRDIKFHHGRLSELVDRILTRVKDEPESSKRCPFLSSLKNMKTANGQPASDQLLKEEILTFLAAGHAPGASTLGWAFQGILSNPEVRTQLVGLVRSPDKAAAMEYIGSIMTETERLHPAFPLLARTTSSETTVQSSSGTVHLQPNTTVVMNVPTMHTREDLWGTSKTGYPAKEFHPERFSAKGNPGAVEARDRTEMYAFGGGPRVCIGMHLARAESQTVLYEFFRNFDIHEAQPGTPPVASRLTQRLTGGTLATLAPVVNSSH